jgi:hypothetical protein
MKIRTLDKQAEQRVLSGVRQVVGVTVGEAHPQLEHLALRLGQPRQDLLQRARQLRDRLVDAGRLGTTPLAAPPAGAATLTLSRALLLALLLASAIAHAASVAVPSPGPTAGEPAHDGCGRPRARGTITPRAVSPERVVPFVLLVLVVAVAVSYARGGRLSRIPEAPLRWPWLLFVGVVVQLAVDVAAARGLLPDAGVSGWLLLLFSQLLVVAFVAANWQLPGMALVTLGLVLNAAVMAANGAMPVDPAAIRALGIDGAEVAPGKHTLMTDETRLRWLADIWPLPPLRTIISVGDVVLAAGLIPLTHALMTHQPASARRGGDAPVGTDDQS